MRLAAIDEPAGGHVADDGVILPAVPEPADDLDRVGRLRNRSLTCRGVDRAGELAGRQLREPAAAEVRRLAAAGRDLGAPARPARTDVVERGDRGEMGTARCAWWSPSGTSPIPEVSGAIRAAISTASSRPLTWSARSSGPSAQVNCRPSASSMVMKSDSPRCASPARPAQVAGGEASPARRGAPLGTPGGGVPSRPSRAAARWIGASAGMGSTLSPGAADKISPI